MGNLFGWLFSSQGFMPHGHCYLWQPGTLWLNVGSDGLIAAAYFAIPVSLFSFVRRRMTDIPFPGIFLMFAAFILLCGLTHTMEIWTVWNPAYRLGGALKLLTGLVSLATTITLVRLIPLALQLRSPQALQREVEARTAELANANAALRHTVLELERQREELKTTHREKNESHALLATTLRSVGDAVISTDAAGSVQFMNTVAEVLTGWTEPEARGKEIEDVFRIVNEQTRQAVESPVSKVLREGSIVGLANHTVLIARDSTERPIEDSGAPITDGGKLVGVVLVFRDATRERAARRALLTSEQALREANTRKDIFLATLSHELRNPLAPIRNAATFLAKPGLSSEDHERSRLIIVRQVRHMASLLDDLLDMSRITRGVFALKKEIVNLQDLLAEALETARPLIDQKRHTVKLEWPSEPVEVEADPIRLVQIATNLLTNAAKYTDPEGVITFGVHATGGDITLFVRDTGIGLAAHDLTEVFEMFSQVSPEQKRSEGGLGIGLALVKGLVELHGGRVEARSEGLERGSEFVVFLPGLPAASAGPATPAAADPGIDPASRRVLIADDNRDGAESLAMLIEFSGHQVYLAYTGVDAFQMAAAHRPHIAILDIGMPGMDGYQVAQKIRDQVWGMHITLIALTGWGQEDDKRRAQRAGFDHHLTKPVDPSVLDRLISAAKPA